MTQRWSGLVLCSLLWGWGLMIAFLVIGPKPVKHGLFPPWHIFLERSWIGIKRGLVCKVSLVFSICGFMGRWTGFIPHYKGSVPWSASVVFLHMPMAHNALYGLMYAYGACTAASRVRRHIHEVAHVYVFIGSHTHLHVCVSTSTCAHQCTHTHSCAYGHVCTYHPQRYTHRIIYTYTPVHTLGHLTWRFCLPAFRELSCGKRTVFKVLNYREHSRAETSALQAGDGALHKALLSCWICVWHTHRRNKGWR